MEDRTNHPRVIDGYRRDTRRKLLAALVPGFLVALVGAVILASGVHSMHRRDPRTAHLTAHVQPLEENLGPTLPEQGLLMVGALLCLASPLVLAFSLRRVVDGDDFLLLRTDGLVHQSGGRALLFPWEEVESIRHDEADDSLVLQLTDGAEFRISEQYTGMGSRDLARRIADFRRKAMWNMLPSQRRGARS